MGLMIAWLGCWFIVSPDPRFMYGVFLFGIFLLAHHLISFIKNKGLIKVGMNVCLIAMIAASSYYLISKLWTHEEYRNWILPAQLPQPPVKEIVIDGITFRVPEMINNNWNARCYGTDLPCLYKIDRRLRARSGNIRSGFRLQK